MSSLRFACLLLAVSTQALGYLVDPLLSAPRRQRKAYSGAPQTVHSVSEEHQPIEGSSSVLLQRSKETPLTQRTRRCFASSVATALAASSIAPRAAGAIPLSDKEKGGLSAVQRALELKRRPRPLTSGRPRKLEQEFAVLLMRSSYAVADELDFVAMDQFQKDFFLFRQFEYLDYVNSLEGSPMMQGDLSSSLYFDFISFAQHDVVSQDMKKGKLTFPEASAVEVPKVQTTTGRTGSGGGGSTSDNNKGVSGEEAEVTEMRWTTLDVERSAELPQENALLPAEFDKRVGDRVLDWLVKRYNDDDGGEKGDGRRYSSSSGGGGSGSDGGSRQQQRCCNVDVFPSSTSSGDSSRPSAEDVKRNIGQLLSWFQVNGYMAGFEVSLVGRDETGGGGGVNFAKPCVVEITVTAPATRWSQEVLTQRGSWVGNAFELKTALAYLRAIGVDAEAVKQYPKFQRGGADVTHRLKLTKGLR
eukprot:CAMPEP_0171930954 /NCGR_PEP_ID=MMETSP0993-20121228/29071_1 /TAXON_ID=483369 /ORGANISM="non described non described, Strain CCMP2098" /LENGTH=471 /DNA_ID=CAMNT_0012570895 /DNA_START=52 /DNA_END=1467 /DNA_ORIENTATION=+